MTGHVAHVFCTGTIPLWGHETGHVALVFLYGGIIPQRGHGTGHVAHTWLPVSMLLSGVPLAVFQNLHSTPASRSSWHVSAGQAGKGGTLAPEHQRHIVSPR